MSVSYGGPPAGGAAYGGGYAPPGRVNFGWIGEAWGFVNQKAGTWILAIILYGIVTNVVNAIIIQALPNPGYIAPPNPFGTTEMRFGVAYGTNSNVTVLGQIVAGLFAWTFGAFQSASLYGVAVKQVRGELISFADAFGGGARFGQMLLLNLVLFFLYILGAVALCLGALVVGAFLLPAQALVADGKTFSEALAESVNAMKNDWLTAAGFVFVFTLLIVVSVIPCGLALLVTIPMLHIVGALAYRDMIGMPGPVSTTGAFGAPGGYGAAQSGVWPPPPEARPPAFGQPPSSDPSSFSPPRRSLSGDDLDTPEQPPTTPPAA
jgi:hypothetical protein